jgi:uncharacterized Zn finger protein (UPF0148 family)
MADQLAECPRCGSELEGLGEGPGPTILFCPNCGWTSNQAAESSGELTAQDVKTPQEGMEEAAKGMTSEALRERYKEIAQAEKKTTGNEMAREVIRKELGDRKEPIP